MLSLKYFVTIYDYDRELHRTVIVNRQKFTTEKAALSFANTVKLGTDTEVVVAGNYGYDRIKTITK